MSNAVLTVRDIAVMPALSLAVAGGSDGLANEVRWLHVSELPDPTPFLEGGELLLTTGLGLGELASAQRAYLRRLADHGLAGLGFGVGFGFADVPPAVVEEANRLGFPVLSVPYEVPFIAITKAAATELASERLAQLTRALEVHERLSDAVLRGRGLDGLLAILANHLACSVALVDEAGRTVSARHAGRRHPFERPLELPVAVGAESMTLKAARDAPPFGDYDRLVLHHGQIAVAFELSRRRAVSAAELRLAGDLIDDLERERLDEREAARRLAAFGLDPAAAHAALLARSRDGVPAEALRRDVARQLEERHVRHLSTVRREVAAFLVEVASEPDAVTLARAVADATDDVRLAVGRPGPPRALGRSLIEARTALDTVGGDAALASFRDLGSLELLLSLPDAALEAFADGVLGPAAGSPRLVESLAALLEAGGRWSDAAARIGVHRHTLRYRMDRLRELTGRHPDDPEQRMELWLAVRARQALAARADRSVPA